MSGGVAGAIASDADRSITFSNGTAATATAKFGPQTFSVEAWFRTSTAGAGKIVGFGNSRTGASGRPDRHLYIGTDGKLRFGIRRSDKCIEREGQIAPACDLGRAAAESLRCVHAEGTGWPAPRSMPQPATADAWREAPLEPRL